MHTYSNEICTLSLHDALPISRWTPRWSATGRSLQENLWPRSRGYAIHRVPSTPGPPLGCAPSRSEEHTSELQSRGHLVCRLLLEKKKQETIKLSTVSRATTR